MDKFREIRPVVLGIARKGNKYGIITLQNEVVVDFIYSRISLFYNGIAIAKKDDYSGAIDIKEMS